MLESDFSYSMMSLVAWTAQLQRQFSRGSSAQMESSTGRVLQPSSPRITVASPHSSSQSSNILQEIVHFLPAADYITMLEEGSIVRNQVTYNSVEPSIWGVLEANSEKRKDSAETGEEDIFEPLEKQQTLAVQAKKTEEDLSRQTGDVECYKIYLRSMGNWVVVLLIVTVAIHVAIQKMPRSFHPCPYYEICMLTEMQRFGYVSGRRGELALIMGIMRVATSGLLPRPCL